MRRISSLLAVVCILPFFASCTVEGRFGPGIVLRFGSAQVLWNSQALNDYDFEYRRGCFCPYQGAIDVQVRGGTVVAGTTESGEPLNAEELAEIPTIPELFDIARDALANADEVSVEYHRTLGHPTLISVDWYEEAVDDEVFYTAKNLEPVP
jgi:hypothetical protein